MFKIILVLSSPQNKSLYFPCSLRNVVLILLLRFACAHCHWLQLGAELSGLSLHQGQQGTRLGQGRDPSPHPYLQAVTECQSNPALGQLKAKARNTTGLNTILIPWKVYRNQRVILLQSALKGFMLVRWDQCPFSEQVPASGSQGSPNDPCPHQNNSHSRGSYSLGKACLALLLLTHLAGRSFSQAEFPP